MYYSFAVYVLAKIIYIVNVLIFYQRGFCPLCLLFSVGIKEDPKPVIWLNSFL